MIAPVTIHAIAKVAEVTQMSLRVLSRILSLRCGGYDRCWDQVVGVSPDSLLSLVGRLLGGTLEFVCRFALSFR